MPVISEFYGIKILMYWNDHLHHIFMQNMEVIK